MTENPYESPHASDGSASLPRNRLARVGFVFSVIGVLAVFLVGPFGPLLGTIGMCMAFLCLPGLALSVMGLRHQPRRLACWGVALGVFGSLYLPTFCHAMSVFVLPRR